MLIRSTKPLLVLALGLVLGVPTASGPMQSSATAAQLPRGYPHRPYHRPPYYHHRVRYRVEFRHPRLAVRTFANKNQAYGFARYLKYHHFLVHRVYHGNNRWHVEYGTLGWKYYGTYRQKPTAVRVAHNLRARGYQARIRVRRG